MATIKSFSDLQQSKKLAKILPLESADMYYFRQIDNDYFPPDVESICPIPLYKDGKEDFNYDIGCWSLAALLNVLPNNKHITTTLSRGGWKIEPVEYIDKWFCEYEDEVDEDSPCRGFTVSADNPVDACYELILKLHERKIL